MGDKIRVVVADDSAFMRKKISDILNSDPDIEVVAVARNGQEAIDAVVNLAPNVVTLDVEMPILNGIEALGYIMSECPTPCVMISAFTKEGAEETIKALEFGAVDFIEKPSGVMSPDIDKKAEEIIQKVKIAAIISRDSLKLIWAEKPKEEVAILKKPVSLLRVFAIASSTGGAQALAAVLPALNGDLPAAFLVVQHMPEGFTKTLADRLNWQSKLSVAEAEDGMPIKPAHVIIARGGRHLEVSGNVDAPYVSIKDGPSRLGVKPCADIMMASAARIFKERTVGVILTGMGSDGTLGAQAIKAEGGLVLAEDESSCVIYGMPKSAFESGSVDKVVALGEMAHEMEKLIQTTDRRPKTEDY